MRPMVAFAGNSSEPPTSMAPWSLTAPDAASALSAVADAYWLTVPTEAMLFSPSSEMPSPRSISMALSTSAASGFVSSDSPDGFSASAPSSSAMSSRFVPSTVPPRNVPCASVSSVGAADAAVMPPNVATPSTPAEANIAVARFSVVRPWRPVVRDASDDSCVRFRETTTVAPQAR